MFLLFNHTLFCTDESGFAARSSRSSPTYERRSRTRLHRLSGTSSQEKFIVVLSGLSANTVTHLLVSTIILGSTSSSPKDLHRYQVFQELRKVLGEIPILASEQRLLDGSGVEDGDKENGEAKASSSKPRVLADGTYATETTFSTSSSSGGLESASANKPPLRAIILAGNFYTGASLATTLTKLALPPISNT